MMKSKILVVLLTFTLSLTLFGASGTYAATYDELPLGKNYIDTNNVEENYSMIDTVDSITVKSNTVYTVSVPFNDPEGYFVAEGFVLVMFIQGNTGYIIEDLTLNSSNYLTVCQQDVAGYLSCTFNTGSNTSITWISFYSPGDSSYVWDGSKEMQLEEGSSGTTYEPFESLITDVTAPVINGGSGLIYQNVNNADSLTTIKATFSATDDTDGVVPITTESDGYTGNEDTLGDYVVVFRATDSSGNYSEFSLTIRVVDTEIPIINLNGNSTVYVEHGNTYSELGATVTDNYDSSINAVITGSVNNSVLGSNTITYNADDSSGNDAIEVTRTVIVQDTTSPIQTLNGSSTIYIEFGDNYTELGASWTDSFDGVGSSSNSGFVNVAVLGTYIKTYSVTDSNGNVAIEITRTVIVRDSTAPSFVGSTIYTWNNTLGYNLNYLLSLITVSDLYSGDLTDDIVIQSDNFTGNISTPGTYTVVLRSTDSTGNYSDMTISITIIDDSAPQFFTSLTIFTLEYANTMTQQDIIDYFNNQ